MIVGSIIPSMDRFWKRGREKYMPALTVPEFRILLDGLLHQAYDHAYPNWAIHDVQRKRR